MKEKLTLTLRNFKCYKKCSFDLKDLTIFCGNNSVGKSTAIQALLLALQSDFSDKIAFSGDLISIGSYKELLNKNSETDTLLISLAYEEENITWGHYLEDSNDIHYDADNYNENVKKLDEGPLPLIKETESFGQFLKSKICNNFQYLCAERWGPRSFYPYSKERRSKNWLGTQGEYTAQVLSELTSKRSILNDNDFRIHPKAHGTAITSNLYEWMSEISPGVFVDSKIIEGADISTNLFRFENESYRPLNVGFGLSYALPIVVALLNTAPGGLIILENPEAHLHPRGQSYLGRLIGLTALSGVKILLETHSDHLLNGIRVTSRLSDSYEKDSFMVYFVSSGKEESEVDDLGIGIKGELSAWPSGFFDQKAYDIKTILRGEEVTELGLKE